VKQNALNGFIIMIFSQHDGVRQFHIPRTDQGLVVVANPLDYESLAEGSNYYILNISASVCLHDYDNFMPICACAGTRTTPISTLGKRRTPLYA
jgi:hypothetical protein